MIDDGDEFVWSVDRRPAEDDVPAAVIELLDAEAEKGVDLEHGPVVRARLVLFEPGEQVLLVSVAAVCADPQSLCVLGAELAASLRGDAALEPPLQYADYAEWRHELLADPEPAAEAGAFWSERQPPAAQDLPFRAETPAGPDASGITRVSLSHDVLDRLAAACGDDRSLVLEACWHAYVARLSGAAEVVLAGTFPGRSQEETVDAIGPYAQLLPLRSRVEEATTLPELVDQLRRARRTQEQWQDYADHDLLQLVADRCPIGFASVEGDISSGARLVAVRRTPPRPVLELRLTPVSVELHWSGALVDADAVDAIAQQLAALALAAADDPAVPVVELELTEPAQRAARAVVADAAERPVRCSGPRALRAAGRPSS